MPVIAVLRRWMQEDEWFKDIIGHIARSVWDTWEKKKKNLGKGGRKRMRKEEERERRKLC